jgi:hypothetical protein
MTFAAAAMLAHLNWATPIMAASTAEGITGQEMLPPNAKPGECYARVYVPPAYKSTEERMLKREASEKVEVIPAKYETEFPAGSASRSVVTNDQKKV